MSAGEKAQREPALTVSVEQSQPAFKILAVEVTAGHAALADKGGTGVQDPPIVEDQEVARAQAALPL
jgi:hypothetical protein